MKNKKQAMILSLVAVITLIILVFGATYAYFQATGGTGASSNLNVTTASTDLTTFKIDKAINIAVTQSDFAKGSGNKSDSTKAIATFTASNSVNVDKSSDRYNIYFIIENNDFIYTTNNTTPEILLNVTDPNGNKVENITGLIHTENGFDITTRTGGFLIIADYDIEANRAKTVSQEWNVEVTFVNLDTDQVKNMGKTLTGKLYLTREKMSSYELAKITNVDAKTTYNSITTTLLSDNGTAEIEKYYFGIEKISNNTTGLLNEEKSVKFLNSQSVSYIETNKATYMFTNLDSNAKYKIYSYGVDKNGIKTNIYETEVTTENYILPSITRVLHSITLNSITLNVDAKAGSNEIIKYYFSKDNGATYEESDGPSYTFSDLIDTTDYKIKVKVLDSYGKYSTEYYEAITTETYILPNVTSVSTSTKYDQISVSVIGTNGTNNIAKYYYSINNGVYAESTNPTYTFKGLSEKTTYTIKVKVADTSNRMSNEYSINATTDTYVLPTITNVTTSSTESSITIKVSGTNGDGTITEYYYSKDNGSNYIKASSSNYTFNDLSPDTTFYIKLFVKDSNGKSSSIYSTSIATKVDNITITLADSTKLNLFTSYCNPQISTDGGNTWSNLSLPTSNGSSFEIKKNSLIRIQNTSTTSTFGCGINFCTSSTCTTEYNYVKNCDSNSLYNFGTQSNIYTLNNNETHYSLVYCSCLAGDTYVYIEDKKKKRKKKIKDLKKGDKVYVIGHDGKLVLNKIAKIHKNTVSTLYQVTLSNGEIIKCSQKHYFLEANMGAMAVEELKKGYELYSADGKSYKIEDINIINYKEGIEVFNLSFEESDLRMFAVSGAMVLTFGVILSVGTSESKMEVKSDKSSILAEGIQFLTAS